MQIKYGIFQSQDSVGLLHFASPQKSGNGLNSNSSDTKTLHRCRNNHTTHECGSESLTLLQKPDLQGIYILAISKLQISFILLVT